MASFNRRAYTGLRTAVMPHQPSDVVLFPVDLVIRPHGVGKLHITADVKLTPNLLQREAVLRSPVTRLPPETLAYIFELCLASEGKSAPVFVPAQGPSCLAQVCKLWRAIAESDPHLYTSIHFYFPEDHQRREEDMPRVKPVFDLHLKRSGTLPISLTFTDYRGYHVATEDLISLLVDQLRTYSRRWKRISLHLSCGYFPLLFTFTPCDLSSLEHLHISGDVIQQRFAAPRLNLESATNLKSFTYSGPGYSVNDRIDLHWDQLAEVSFEFEPHDGISSTLSRQFRYLAQCQNITTCSLGINHCFRLGPSGGQAITFPRLRTLRVRRLHPESHARSLIDPLILPQLQTLEIDTFSPVGSDGWNSPSPWHDRNFSNLLARSGCTLHHLSIQDVYFPNEELVRCLALSHTLTSFRFIPCPRSQDIVDVIHKLDVSQSPGSQGHGQECTVTDGPLVPGLREITLASSVERYLDLMMAMCRSRGGARARAARVAPLRRVEVVFFDMPHVIVGRPGDRFPGRVVSFQGELAQWVSENEKEKKESENGICREDEERLEASVVVDSPYLVEYIDIDSDSE